MYHLKFFFFKKTQFEASFLFCSALFIIKATAMPNLIASTLLFGRIPSNSFKFMRERKPIFRPNVLKVMFSKVKKREITSISGEVKTLSYIIWSRYGNLPISLRIRNVRIRPFWFWILRFCGLRTRAIFLKVKTHLKRGFFKLYFLLAYSKTKTLSYIIYNIRIKIRTTTSISSEALGN